VPEKFDCILHVKYERRIDTLGLAYGSVRGIDVFEVQSHCPRAIIPRSDAAGERASLELCIFEDVLNRHS
jgi:hypothetical protein